MPANKRPRRLNYAVNKKGPKAGNKVKKAVIHFKKLQERELFEGRTKWISNAFAVVSKKLKKYGINTKNI